MNGYTSRASKYDKYRDEWATLYSDGISTVDIAGKYQCPIRSVQRWSRDAGISRYNYKYTKYYDEWIELYKSGRSTLYISGMYNCSIHAVSNVIKTAGITRSYSEARKTNHNSKYSNVDKYFDILDTSDKCYWLGILLADGCIYNQGNGAQQVLSIGLQSDDGYILSKLSDALGRNITQSPGKGSNKTQLRVKIVSDHVVNTLIGYGFTYRKSYDNHEATIFNHIPSEYMSHFIRGLIDGDGHITTTCTRRNKGGQIGICGNGNDMDAASTIISNIGCRKSPLYKRGNIYYVSWASRADVTSIIHYLYDDSTIYLTRKKAKADEILALYVDKDRTHARY